MPQAAIVAALLHQKLLTGVERSSKAVLLRASSLVPFSVQFA
jgi:hypothetical protein